jgi:DNA-binding XRE family transcriptional regulator
MNIKELRTKEGLSQSALAKKLGIATSAIGHMENGRMKVSAKIAAKVKEEFGVDVADAVGIDVISA